MSFPQDLIAALEPGRTVFIQSHDFPDHDSLAAAFGLSHLLSRLNWTTKIVYGGDTTRSNLASFVEDLDIPVHHYSSVAVPGNAQVVVVDSRPGNGNVTSLPGTVRGVIDHHKGPETHNGAVCDLRTELGACSTIIAGYYLNDHVPIPRSVATALMLGIKMDTLSLSRNVNRLDLEAYYRLFPLADMAYVQKNVRNNIQMDDLIQYKRLLEGMDVRNGFAYMFFPKGCPQSLLAILANFLLRVDEIHTVLLSAANGESVIYSLRTEHADLDASSMINHLLEDVGVGGGHQDMAGGLIPNGDRFDEHRVREAFFSLAPPQ